MFVLCTLLSALHWKWKPWRYKTKNILTNCRLYCVGWCRAVYSIFLVCVGICKSSMKIFLFTLSEGAQIFLECRSHFQIPGARMVTWNSYFAEGLYFWSGVWTSLLTWHFLFGVWEGMHSSNCIVDKVCHHTHFRWSRFVHLCTYSYFTFAVV